LGLKGNISVAYDLQSGNWTSGNASDAHEGPIRCPWSQLSRLYHGACAALQQPNPVIPSQLGNISSLHELAGFGVERMRKACLCWISVLRPFFACGSRERVCFVHIGPPDGENLSFASEVEVGTRRKNKSNAVAMWLIRIRFQSVGS
jgi:hypothetical protein